MYENFNRYNPYSNELYHYGILGMKWGVRRYQNADGSYTSAGRVRYGKMKKVLAAGPGPSEGDEPRKKKKDKDPVEKSSNAFLKGTSGVKGIVERYGKTNTSERESRKMSDEELRTAINRMNLERQYDQLTGAEYTEGINAVRDVIDTMGDLARIVQGGIIIYRTLSGH